MVLRYFLVLFFFFSSSQAYSQTLDYQYDELGRLTVVKEGGQVKVAYCYDKAGNRTSVNLVGGRAEDCVSAGPPPKPSHLSQGNHRGGGCYFSWRMASDPAYFQVRWNGGGNWLTLTGNKRNHQHNTKCADWIRACNDQDMCSDNAYF